MLFTTTVFTHAAAFLGYVSFATLLAFRGSRTWLTAFLVLASAATAAWAGTSVLVEWSLLPSWTADLAEPLRDGAWFAIVLAVLYAAGHDDGVWRGLVVTAGCVVFLDSLFSATGIGVGPILGLPFDSRITGIATGITGLMLIENMMRNLARDQIWGVKLLAIGLGAVLSYQLLAQLPEFLTSIPVEGLSAALPLVFLVVLPLFITTAVRNPVSALRIHSSRRIVFHTTALIGVGILLQGAAAAAYYIRNYGGDGATALSIVVGFGCLIVVAVAATSGSVRSRLNRFINENFFSYKFDYRLEWDKFIRALSALDDGNMQLRVLRTLAELLDSSGGALWVYRERLHQYVPVAHWSMHSELAPFARDDARLAVFMNENCVYLELSSTKASPLAPAWRELFPTAWLVVPLRYRAELIGIAVVNRPRAERELDWEDENLISLMSLQLAAYLVQEETVEALADARQLQEFNKRFAFIVHDTKNTVGQLSLLVRNVEEFGHDEEFRKDMVMTLRHSVEKLQGLLTQLRGDAGARTAKALPSPQEVNLTTMVAAFVREKRKLGLDVVMNESAVSAFAQLSDEKAFLGVIEHLVTNAIEATPQGSPVSIRVGSSDGSIRVTIADKGPGMSQEFIAQQLFRPLQTTKGKGFGIGTYQAREVVRDLGGNIDVSSKVGEGTTVSLSLPIAFSRTEAAGA